MASQNASSPFLKVGVPFLRRRPLQRFLLEVL